jgi:hypothetical protein
MMESYLSPWTFAMCAKGRVRNITHGPTNQRYAKNVEAQGMSEEAKKLQPRAKGSLCQKCGMWHEDFHSQCNTVWVNGVEHVVPEKQPARIEVRNAH